jgi:hypothetical protein
MIEAPHGETYASKVAPPGLARAKANTLSSSNPTGEAEEVAWLTVQLEQLMVDLEDRDR